MTDQSIAATMTSTVTGTDVPHGWVRRYLAVLGVDHDTPSLPALAWLIRAHIQTITFENITSQLRRGAQPEGPVPPPDPEALLGNWEQGLGGGVCYEFTPMVGRLLGALGYRATPVLGQMSLPDQVSFPGGHQALLVELDGRRYLVDVGCGAPIFEPVPLHRLVEVRRAGLVYRFQLDEATGTFSQDRRIAGEWIPYCRYDLHLPLEPTRETAYQRHHTPGGSWVLERPRLIRCEDDAVFTLNGDEFAQLTVGGKHRKRITDPAEYAHLAAEVFRLPKLPIEEARRARAAWARAPMSFSAYSPSR